MPTKYTVKNAFQKLEGCMAAKMLNADLEKDHAKYEIASDSEYGKFISDKSTGGDDGETFDHSVWDKLMKTYVFSGTIDGVTTNVVNYKALAEDPGFDQYCSSMQSVDLSSLRHPNELLALYINAYNALCIGHVVRYYKGKGKFPSSVKNITNVWDIEAGVVGGETVSLSDVEHKILRSRWADPRIHASIVCASASCPNLRKEAFVASKINEQMDDQSREWMADTTKGAKAKDSGKAKFSRILLWFKDDFSTSDTDGPMEWARKYMPVEGSKMINPKIPQTYFTYNWHLNNKVE